MALGRCRAMGSPVTSPAVAVLEEVVSLVIVASVMSEAPKPVGSDGRGPHAQGARTRANSAAGCRPDGAPPRHPRSSTRDITPDTVRLDPPTDARLPGSEKADHPHGCLARPGQRVSPV